MGPGEWLETSGSSRDQVCVCMCVWLVLDRMRGGAQHDAKGGLGLEMG